MLQKTKNWWNRNIAGFISGVITASVLFGIFWYTSEREVNVLYNDTGVGKLQSYKMKDGSYGLKGYNIKFSAEPRKEGPLLLVVEDYPYLIDAEGNALLTGGYTKIEWHNFFYYIYKGTSVGWANYEGQLIYRPEYLTSLEMVTKESLYGSCFIGKTAENAYLLNFSGWSYNRKPDTHEIIEYADGELLLQDPLILGFRYKNGAYDFYDQDARVVVEKATEVRVEKDLGTGKDIISYKSPQGRKQFYPG